MSFASIMVHVDRSPEAARRIALAQDIANTFDAKLIGVAARRPTLAPLSESDTFNDAALERAEAEEIASLNAVERSFIGIAGHRNGIMFRSTIGVPADYLSEQSCAADLVVVGRRGGDCSFDGRFGVDPGELVLGLGRPMLLAAPHVTNLDPSRVVVAWKNTREARRAVHDSLPFLKLADEVFVTTVVENGDDQGADDVVELLERHGVKATTHRVLLPERSSAVELLDVVRHLDAGLIVAGAYGYSRFREWLFGGATRDLLRLTPVCCLMSH